MLKLEFEDATLSVQFRPDGMVDFQRKSSFYSSNFSAKVVETGGEYVIDDGVGTYRLRLDGNTLKGFFKVEGGMFAREVKITLKPAADAAPLLGKGQAYNAPQLTTPAASPFVQTWIKNGSEYKFNPDGTGTVTGAGDKPSPLRWESMGTATFQRVPTPTGGRDGSWTGPKMRWWFGEKAGGAGATELGVYDLNGRKILVPNNFYDGRSWYSQKQ